MATVHNIQWYTVPHRHTSLSARIPIRPGWQPDILICCPENQYTYRSTERYNRNIKFIIKRTITSSVAQLHSRKTVTDIYKVFRHDECSQISYCRVSYFRFYQCQLTIWILLKFHMLSWYMAKQKYANIFHFPYLIMYKNILDQP